MKTISRSAVAILVLSTLLVSTNLLWAYPHLLPNAPELPAEYRCASDEHRLELMLRVAHPLAEAIAASAQPGATRESIIAAASGTSVHEHNRFCANGGTDPKIERVKFIALRFDDAGRLVGASSEPCFNDLAPN